MRRLYDKYRDYLLVLLVMVSGYLTFAHIMQSREIVSISRLHNTERQQFSAWRDQLGREHQQIKVVTETITQLQPVYRSKIDTVAKMLKIASQDINVLTEARTRTQNTVIFKRDTIAGSFSFNDGYLSILGKTDTGTYTYTDRLHHVTYIKRKKFLGITIRKNKYMDMYFDNPNTHILDATYIDLTKEIKRNRWGIGPSAGVTYYDGSIHPYIGVGINYNIVEW